jgi:hypothetical protein
MACNLDDGLAKLLSANAQLMMDVFYPGAEIKAQEGLDPDVLKAANEETAELLNVKAEEFMDAAIEAGFTAHQLRQRAEQSTASTDDLDWFIRREKSK